VIFGSTRISVLRGDTGTEDGFGDVQDTDTPAIEHVPAWIEDGSISRRDDASGQRITLSGFWVALRATLPFEIVATDRIKDEHTGDVLQVETIRTDSGWGGKRRRIFCTMAA
jgi:hypothetical protein